MTGRIALCGSRPKCNVHNKKGEEWQWSRLVPQILAQKKVEELKHAQADFLGFTLGKLNAKLSQVDGLEFFHSFPAQLVRD